METIFENNVTKLEIEILTSCAPNKSRWEKDKYTQYSDIDTVMLQGKRYYFEKNIVIQFYFYIKLLHLRYTNNLIYPVLLFQA
jgi:hypothetical protein